MFCTLNTVSMNCVVSANSEIKEDMIDCCFHQDTHILTACDQIVNKVSTVGAVLIVCGGIVGNMIALTVLYRMKRCVRTVMVFIFLLGLAISDLVGIITAGSIGLNVYIYQLVWQGGQPLCCFNGFFIVTTGIISSLLIWLMAVERFVAIKYPEFYSKVAKSKNAMYAILGCCVFAALFASLPLMGLGRYVKHFPGTWCFLNYFNKSPSASAIAHLFAFLMSFLIISTAFFNCFLVVILVGIRHRRRTIDSLTDSDSPRLPTLMLQTDIDTTVAIFLVTITIVFCLTWTPMILSILINQYHNERYLALDHTTVRMVFINHMINPWLYIILRRKNTLLPA